MSNVNENQGTWAEPSQLATDNASLNTQIPKAVTTNTTGSALNVNVCTFLLHPLCRSTFIVEFFLCQLIVGRGGDIPNKAPPAPSRHLPQ